MNIALVGLGGMGSVHLNNYARLPDVAVTGAVGRGEADEARAAQWGIPLFATLAALCAAVPVDLVDICAPTYLHKAFALEGFSLGKHVLTEKPAALCAADARAMFAAADAAGRQLYVAQLLQFSREAEALHEAVRSARYGRPLDACFERLTACPAWTQGSWMFDKTKSGLLPYDLHIHDLDLIVSLFGKPESVSYTAAGSAEKPYREQYRFRYGYPGLTVAAEAAWFDAPLPFTARWRVYFERGMLVCDAGGLTAYHTGGAPEPVDVTDPVKVPTGINLPPTGWFLRELTHITACAREGRPSERVPREQVLAVLEVLDGITL